MYEYLVDAVCDVVWYTCHFSLMYVMYERAGYNVIPYPVSRIPHPVCWTGCKLIWQQSYMISLAHMVGCSRHCTSYSNILYMIAHQVTLYSLPFLEVFMCHPECSISQHGYNAHVAGENVPKLLLALHWDSLSSVCCPSG